MRNLLISLLRVPLRFLNASNYIFLVNRDAG
jgi:hypothetical protein